MKNKMIYMRDVLKLIWSFLFFWLYIPHSLAFLLCRGGFITSDLSRKKRKVCITMNTLVALIFFLHTDRYFRSLFYFRIGPMWASLISWIRPGDRYFILSKTMKVGKELGALHPYATVLNAASIGNHFTCLNCTTVGSKGTVNKPIIGDNVTLCANVTIIGNVRIGNNVTVGAGSVVVKDIPDNCVVVGNPARIIKFKN